MINRSKVICLEERNPPLRDLARLGDSPGIRKELFTKSMEDDLIQQAFSKYISIYLDTWKKHIFERYEEQLPQKITECT
jgi:hypothetical protein